MDRSWRVMLEETRDHIQASRRLIRSIRESRTLDQIRCVYSRQKVLDAERLLERFGPRPTVYPSPVKGVRR